MKIKRWLVTMGVLGLTGFLSFTLYVDNVNASAESLGKFMSDDFVRLKEAPQDVKTLDWLTYYEPLVKLHDNRNDWGLESVESDVLVSSLREYKRFSSNESLDVYLTELGKLELSLEKELERKQKIIDWVGSN